MGMQGDFLQLLKERGYAVRRNVFRWRRAGLGGIDITKGTTILAMKYRDGVPGRRVIAAPRQAIW